MLNLDNFISGEKFQQICDVYCGTEEFLFFNPPILSQYEKHFFIEKLNTEWDNPRLIFCYSSCLSLFMQKLGFLKNPFVLVSHNGDENVTEKYKPIADHPLLIQWFAQNLLFEHSKIHWLPIAIANQMWPHGNLDSVQYFLELSSSIPKDKNIYFFFSLHTNEKERKHCKKILEDKGLLFGDEKSFVYYLVDLASHKFSISPPGNGIDCHRIWESFYCGTIPILLKNTFTETISRYFPCILLDSWDNFDIDTVLSSYNPTWKIKAQESPYLLFETWKKLILDAQHLPV